MAQALTPMGIWAVAKNVDKFTRDVGKMNKAIEGTTAAQKKLEQQQGIMATRMSLLTQKYEEQRRAAEKLRQNMTRLGAGLIAVGGATGLFLAKATQLAGRVQTLGVVTAQLGKNIGKTEIQIRGLEQAIVDQGITLQSARQSIAMMIGAEVDLANATELARLAQNAAVIANMDSSEAFQTLVAVIQTGNIRMGRTLGLQLRFQAAYERTAKAIGVATDDLTEQQRVQARTNEVMRAGRNIIGTYEAARETAVKKLLSLNLHVDVCRRAFGEAFLSVYADVIDKVTDSLKVWEGLNKAQQVGIATAVGVGAAFSVVLGSVLILLAKLPMLTAAVKALWLILAANPWIAVATAIAAIVVALVSHNAKVKQAQKDIDSLGKEYRGTNRSYEDYVKATEEYAEAAGLAIKETKMITRTTAAYGSTQEIVTEQIEVTTGEIEVMTREMHEQVASAEQADEMMLRFAASHQILTQEQMTAARQQRAVNQRISEGEAAMRAQEDALKSATTAWDTINTKLADTVVSMKDNIAWMAGGGLELQALAQSIQNAFLVGDIGAEEAQERLNQVGLASLALQENIGITPSIEANKQAVEEFGIANAIEAEKVITAYGEDIPAAVSLMAAELQTATEEAVVRPFEDASLFAAKIGEELDAIADVTVKEVQIQVEAMVNITMSRLPEFQHGGQFTVGGKPGIDQNLVAFRATRGEVVTVTPTSQVDNRSVNTGDIHMGGGGMSPQSFDRMMRDWIGA